MALELNFNGGDAINSEPKESNLPSRSEVIFWWESLRLLDKAIMFYNYKKNNFTPANNYREITGREIGLIYEKYNS